MTIRPPPFTSQRVRQTLAHHQHQCANNDAASDHLLQTPVTDDTPSRLRTADLGVVTEQTNAADGRSNTDGRRRDVNNNARQQEAARRKVTRSQSLKSRKSIKAKHNSVRVNTPKATTSATTRQQGTGRDSAADTQDDVK